jgi:hypothetical protein
MEDRGRSTRRRLRRHLEAREARLLGAYRLGHATAAECQEAACLVAIAAYSLESARRPTGRGRRSRALHRLRAIFAPLAMVALRPRAGCS